MRPALILTALLLASPALALSEQEAHDAYVACFAKAADRLMPNWCSDPDKLAEYSHQACLQQTANLSQAAKIRSPEQARRNALLDARLAMLGRLRAYNNAGKCTR